MSSILNSSRFIMSAMIILLLLGGAGCKSKKKAMEAAKAEAERARMEQLAADQKAKQQEEEMRRREAEEQAKRDAAAAATANAPAKRLESYFNAITNSGDVAAANNNINEALSLFASPETPVLIVISEEGGQKDYDRPTTIRDYLNYLKDQKKNPNKLGNLQFDAAGKITEVELIKY